MKNLPSSAFPFPAPLAALLPAGLGFRALALLSAALRPVADRMRMGCCGACCC